MTVQALQNGNSNGNNITGNLKLTKLKCIKSEKTSNSGEKAHTETSLNQQFSPQQAVLQYRPGEGSNEYYTPLASNGHTDPASPGGIIGAQCSPSATHSQMAATYPTSKENILPQAMNMYHLQPYTSNMSSNLYTADPASPMQTAYPQMAANDFPMEANPMLVQHSQSLPSHPPPNYTEATATAPYTHLPPNYNSIMIGTNYPLH